MKTLIAIALLSQSLAWGQYKLEAGGAAPVAADQVAKAGAKIVDGAGKTVAEVWLRTPIPTGAKSDQQAVTLPEVAHGTFMGLIRFAARYEDRRGQTIKPGTYTLRYSYFPQNGDHQGVAPQRDFLLLTPVEADPDLAKNPTFEQLMEMSRKASGTPHPCVFSFWKEEESFEAGLKQLGEHDWVLYTKDGGIKLGIILVGKAEG
ncbi:MAG: hypothetical protein ACK6DX_09590 [Acidobacteriota bacterium]